MTGGGTQADRYLLQASARGAIIILNLRPLACTHPFATTAILLFSWTSLGTFLLFLCFSFACPRFSSLYLCFFGWPRSGPTWAGPGLLDFLRFSSAFPCFSCAFVVLAGLRVVYLNSFSSIIYWLWPGVTLCPPRLYYYLPGVECLHFGKTSHPADIILLFCLESCAWSRTLRPKLILFIFFSH